MYYGVFKGHKTGVYKSFNAIKKLIEGYPDPVYKRFIFPSDAEYFALHGKEPEELIAEKTKTTKTHASSIPTPITLKTKISVTKTHMEEIIDSISSTAPAVAPLKGKFSGSVDQLAEKYYNNFPFSDNTLYAYTDGSTVGNGRANAKGGHGVFFSDPRLKTISKKRLGKVTNNITELSAIIDALQTIKDRGIRYDKIIVVTDSEYSYKALTERYNKWKANNWNVSYKGRSTPVKNKELIQEGYALCKELHLRFKHTYAQHDTGATDKHSCGNKIADLLAKRSYC